MTVAVTRSGVEIQETPTQVAVIIQIPQISAENWRFRIFQQALLLWGEQLEQVKIDGYCDFSYPALQFHKLVALPHPVQPEAIAIELRTKAIVFTLSKCNFS